MTIGEALLSTLATPPLFIPTSIHKESSTFEYIGGDISLSNPTQRIVAETQMAFGSEDLIACILSLGCGHPGVIVTPDDSSLNMWNDFLVRLVKDSERVSQEVDARIGHLGIFHRFSVTEGLEHVTEKSIFDTGGIVAHTRAYLDDVSVTEKMALCIDVLNTRLGISSLEQMSELNGSCDCF